MERKKKKERKQKRRTKNSPRLWRVNLTKTLPKTSLKCKFDIIIVDEFSYPSMSGTSLSNCLTASIRASGVEGGPSRDIGKPMATQRTNTSMNTDNRHQCCRRKRTPEKKRNMRKLCVTLVRFLSLVTTMETKIGHGN